MRKRLGTLLIVLVGLGSLVMIPMASARPAKPLTGWDCSLANAAGGCFGESTIHHAVEFHNPPWNNTTDIGLFEGGSDEIKGEPTVCAPSDVCGSHGGGAGGWDWDMMGVIDRTGFPDFWVRAGIMEPDPTFNSLYFTWGEFTPQESADGDPAMFHPLADLTSNSNGNDIGGYTITQIYWYSQNTWAVNFYTPAYRGSIGTRYSTNNSMTPNYHDIGKMVTGLSPYINEMCQETEVGWIYNYYIYWSGTATVNNYYAVEPPSSIVNIPPLNAGEWSTAPASGNHGGEWVATVKFGC